jgi:Carboxypeptidase regulatory-like domain
MRNSLKLLFCLLFAAIISLNLSQRVHAVELITNGGFENATAFSGWVTSNSPNPWRLLQNTGPGSGGGFAGVAVTSVAPGGGLTRNAWTGMTDNVTTNSTWNFYQQVTIPANNSVTVSWKDRYQINHVTFCPGGACTPKFYFVEITDTAGAILQGLHTQSTTGNVFQDTGWVTRSVSMPFSPTARTVRLRFRGTETTPLTGPGQVEIDMVSMNTLAPTAADASVNGRVTSATGRGISRARLTITDSQTGEIKYASSNQFGYYRFGELETGHFYILNIQSKQYVFQPDTQSFQLNENLEGVNFVGVQRE